MDKQTFLLFLTINLHRNTILGKLATSNTQSGTEHSRRSPWRGRSAEDQSEQLNGVSELLAPLDQVQRSKVRTFTVAGIMAPLCCQFCSSKFIYLRELVSHVRGSHSEGAPLGFVCHVNECEEVFVNTNSWYRHVIKKHRDLYVSRTPGTHCVSDATYPHNLSSDPSMLDSTDDPSTHYVADNSSSAEDSGDNGGCNDDTSVCMENDIPTFISERDIATKLIRLKEKHMLSVIALNEVVDLVKLVCDNTIASAMSAITLAGELSELDPNS